jgi:hypothetical protein
MSEAKNREHYDLERAMDILRALTARTPIFPGESAVEIEEEVRNDLEGT